MRLWLGLGLGLRMRRRCGDGGGGAAVGCSRLPSATRPAAERPAELWASGIPSLLTVNGSFRPELFVENLKWFSVASPGLLGFIFFYKLAF